MTGAIEHYRMPRLFTAIELPETLRLRLSLLGAPLRGARWVAAANLHLTLRFAGDVEAREADAFAVELARVTHASFTLRIAGVGSFGSREPKVIWAGIEPSEELLQLQRLNERAARMAGLAPEPHAFKPHVTLARLRGASVSEVAAFLGSHGAFAGEPFTVARFVLLSARPGGGGGPYAVEDSYPLDDTDLAEDDSGDAGAWHDR